LLDVRLPKMSGPELLVELLDCLVPLNLSIQFVLMSGYAEPEVTDAGEHNEGRYPFLQKPFTSFALLELVRRKLDSVRLRGRAG
jgi:FixJ family two-component response regulator